MSSSLPARNEPFRWDLVNRDQLGSLLEGCAEPDLWYLDDLTRCAAQVVARSADGDLYFVGRSADSVHDLLGGAMAATSWRDRLHILPFSRRGGVDSLTRDEVLQWRGNLAAARLAPAELARRRRPVVFVDLVLYGYTFTSLYQLLRGWIDEERAQWDVIRTKLRFIGITRRGRTSPNTWRWQQHAGWPAALPARAIVNVSIDWRVWSQLGDRQYKTTLSFHSSRWSDESIREPLHNPAARQALAEAVAVVEHGRKREIRHQLARLMAAEPAFAERWLRSLAVELRR
jgi:hypothetical protein